MSIRVEGEKSSDTKIILIPKYVKEFSIELLNDWIRMQSITHYKVMPGTKFRYCKKAVTNLDWPIGIGPYRHWNQVLQ